MNQPFKLLVFNRATNFVWVYTSNPRSPIISFKSLISPAAMTAEFRESREREICETSVCFCGYKSDFYCLSLNIRRNSQQVLYKGAMESWKPNNSGSGALEGVESKLMLASGMCASVVSLMALVSAGGHVVTTTDCYRKGQYLLRPSFPKWGSSFMDYRQNLKRAWNSVMVVDAPLNLLVAVGMFARKIFMKGKLRNVNTSSCFKFSYLFRFMPLGYYHLC